MAVGDHHFQFAFTEAQEVADFQGESQLVQGLLTYQIGPQTREITLRKILMASKKTFGNHAIQYAVAKELQPFVMESTVATMRQCRLEQFLCCKWMAEGSRKLRKGHP